MKPNRRRRLVEIMTALPHDPAFMVSLMNEFRDELTAHARWQVRGLGVWADRDVIDDLVIEYAVELHQCAAAWRCDGGALPWVWASARLRNVTIEMMRPELMLDRALPEGFDPRDDTTPVWHTHDGVVDWMAELTHLGEVDERVATFVEAVDCHSKRDVCMLVEFLDRRRSGEPAPGDSAAEVFDVKPATLRKAVQRIRQTLRIAELHQVLPDLFCDRDRCSVADEGPHVLETAPLEPIGTPVRELDAA